ncbi:MAG TPA: sugar ABC transporter substrate-binding protein [Herpetosiphonaceae bacterium]
MYITRRMQALVVLVLLSVLTACGSGGAGGTGGNATAEPAGSAAPGATSGAASGGTQGSAAPTGEAVTIKWGFWGEPGEKATHEKVAQAFMQEHPEIKIEIWHQPWGDYFTKLQTLWAGGDKQAIPDVMFLFPVPRYAADGVLENLDPWIQKDNIKVDDYWPALLESVKYNNSIYGLPRDIGLEVLYYNKQIFDEAGVAYPTDTWTWDDLKAAAEKLTVVEGGGRVKRYALGMEGGKYSLWLNQNKASILDDMRNPSKCTMADPKAVEAIKLFSEMMNQNQAMRDANLSQAGGDAAVFQSGQVAMIIQNASRISAFNEAGLSYDVAPVPFPKDGQRAASAGGAAWSMSSSSAHKEAAWTFLSWLQSTNGGQRLYTESGEIFPALQSTARSEAFLKSQQPPASRQAFLTEGENARVGRFGYFPEWGELEDSVISPGLQRIWAGEATPEQALPEICGQVDSFLKERGYPKQ